VIHRLLLALVPAHDRDAVLGDLNEELPPGGARMAARRLLALSGIGLRYEIEPYGVAGGAWAGAGIPAGYDPVSNALLELWASPHALGMLSALMAGLLAGRAGSGTARRHVVIALSALALLSAPGFVAGAAAAGLCLAGACLGAAARREPEPDRVGATGF